MQSWRPSSRHHKRAPDGSWIPVQPDANRTSAIICKICDRGELKRKTKHRLGGPAVFIGYLLLIPSCFGIALSALILFAANGLTDNNDGGPLIAAIGSGTAVILAIASIVGGLLGWLLTMKQSVLRCSFCGAEINASTPKNWILIASAIGTVVLFLILGSQPANQVSQSTSHLPAPVERAAIPMGGTGSAIPNQQPAPAQSATSVTDLPDQRLADLKKRKGWLDSKLAIEDEVTRRLARESINASHDPSIDQSERMDLATRMEGQDARHKQLTTELAFVVAEIAQENQPSLAQPPVATTAAFPPAAAEGSDSSPGDKRSSLGKRGAQPPPEVLKVLDEWVATVRSCDVAAHGALYNETVDTFYSKHDLTNTDVVNETASICRTYTAFPSVNLSDIIWSAPSADSQQAEFDKEFRATKARGGTYEGKVHSQLTLKQTPNGWRIVGEKDTHVYWTKQAR